jgi:hypothetical protein
LEALLTLLIFKFNWLAIGLIETFDILFTDLEAGKGGSEGLFGILKGLIGFSYICIFDRAVLFIS